jgi:hypothetical protein
VGSLCRSDKEIPVDYRLLLYHKLDTHDPIDAVRNSTKSFRIPHYQFYVLLFLWYV